MKKTPQLPEYGWHTPKAASPSFPDSMEPVPAMTEPTLPPLPDEPLPLHPISCPAGPFSVRTKRILFNDRILTLYDLLRHTEEDLFDLKGFGKKCLREVESYLAGKELELREHHVFTFAPDRLPPTIERKMDLAGYPLVSDLRRILLTDILIPGPPLFLSDSEATYLTNYLVEISKVPRPQNIDEFLLLLQRSTRARDALQYPTAPGLKHLIDRQNINLRLLEAILPAISDKRLHPRALLTWKTVATFASQMNPAPGSITDVIEASNRDNSFSPHLVTPSNLEDIVTSLEAGSLGADLARLITLTQLDSRQLTILTSRYRVGARFSLPRLAARYRVSRTRIHNIQRETASKLLHYYQAEPLPILRSALAFGYNHLPTLSVSGRIPQVAEAQASNLHDLLSDTTQIISELPTTRRMLMFYSALLHAQHINRG